MGSQIIQLISAQKLANHFKVYVFRCILTCLGLLLGVVTAEGQIPQNLQFQIQNSGPDSNRLNMLVNLGTYYLHRPSEFKQERFNAIIYFNKALYLSNMLQLNKKRNEVLLLMAEYYFLNNNSKGDACMIQVIHNQQENKDKQREAKTWERWGDYLSVEDGNIPSKIRYYQKAATLFRQLDLMQAELQASQKVARQHLNQKKIDLAETELLYIAGRYHEAGYGKLHYLDDLLADVYQSKSDLHKELFYRLNAVKSMEAANDTTNTFYFYEKLAQTYADLGEFDKSLKEVLKSLDIMKRTNQLADFYGYLSLVSFDLLAEGKPVEALAYLQKSSKEIPPFNIAQREDLYECYGNCFAAMKQYDKAEHFYMSMIRDFKKTMFNRDYYSNNSEMGNDFVHYSQTLSNFYVITKQYKKAQVYVDQLLHLPNGTVRPFLLGQMQLNAFRVDSAKGNYISAINHYEQNRKINDSLFNLVKSKQIFELQIKYQTEKKEASIRLLKNEARIETQKGALQRRISIAGVILLLIIAGLAYKAYLTKRHSNLRLRHKQTEINQQNSELQQLVNEKDNLITEKDWLLKEVQHRVKNNLQIVMSLLNTQSAYLQNEAAREAINDTQHRLNAISLIHKKLYEPGSLSNVPLPDYIKDLVGYLSDCFNAVRHSISFELFIEPLALQPAQAIPLGLILNEAITNAIRHAFGATGGIITISGLLNVYGQVLFSVADNGKGLSKNFNMDYTTSLGMEMMKVLSKQLGASIHVANESGVAITISFKPDQTSHNLKNPPPTACDVDF